MFGIFSQIQGWIKLKGGTDGTFVGNTGDSLKTNVTSSALPSGASTLAEQQTQSARVGDLAETAPATDTASSGLNGRLQRIAQRISSLMGLFPTSVGQKTMAQSLAVTIASDQIIGTAGLVNDGSLFSASADINAAQAGTDNGLLYLRNPAGSGKFLYVWRGRFGSTVSNVAIEFNIYANPTISANGTSLAIANRFIGGTGLPATVALATTLPTVTTKGTLLTIGNVGSNSNSIDINEDFAIKVAPGNSLLITGNPLSNNRNAAVTFVWQEKTT